MPVYSNIDKFAGLKELIGDLTADAYAYKSNYSKSISDIYLFYNRNTIVYGIAVKKIKLFQDLNVLILVTKTGNTYHIKSVKADNLNKIESKSMQDEIMVLLHALNGLTMDQVYDAATGATKYTKKVYISVKAGASHLIEEIGNKPKWKKISL